MSDATWMLGAVLGVFFGGMLGGFIRWAIMAVVDNLLVATFIANIAASGIIGVAIFLPSLWQTAVGVGFAGALSTLSLLARQLGALIKDGKFRLAAEYGISTAAFAVLAAGIGAQVASFATR